MLDKFNCSSTNKNNCKKVCEYNCLHKSDLFSGSKECDGYSIDLSQDYNSLSCKYYHKCYENGSAKENDNHYNFRKKGSVSKNPSLNDFDELTSDGCHGNETESTVLNQGTCAENCDNSISCEGYAFNSSSKKCKIFDKCYQNGSISAGFKYFRKKNVEEIEPLLNTYDNLSSDIGCNYNKVEEVNAETLGECINKCNNNNNGKNKCDGVSL